MLRLPLALLGQSLTRSRLLGTGGPPLAVGTSTPSDSHLTTASLADLPSDDALDLLAFGEGAVSHVAAMLGCGVEGVRLCRAELLAVLSDPDTGGEESGGSGEGARLWAAAALDEAAEVAAAQPVPDDTSAVFRPNGAMGAPHAHLNCGGADLSWV